MALRALLALAACAPRPALASRRSPGALLELDRAGTADAREGKCCCTWVACTKDRHEGKHVRYQYQTGGVKYCCQRNPAWVSTCPVDGSYQWEVSVLAPHVEAENACTCHWDVFGPGGPKFSDVAQGRLGTCYFLASMAAIAHAQPEIITKMFLDQELWQDKRPVFRTRWLVNGKPVVVAVDDLVPVDEVSQPHFVTYNTGHDFWPIILEKAWAKLFGNFKAVEAGLTMEVFKLAARAPQRRLMHVEGDWQEQLWENLLEATEQRFPTTSAARGGCCGIATAHAYAFLGAEVRPDGVRAVRMYNPWGINLYNGSLQHLKNRDGSFLMDLAEYYKAFSDTYIARARPGYSTSSVVAAEAAMSLTTTLKFSLKTSKPVSVQLEWPINRFAKGSACEQKWPISANMIVSHRRRRAPDMASAIYFDHLTMELPAEAGDYEVGAFVNFPVGNWQVVASVYAPEPVDISFPQLVVLPDKSVSADNCSLLLKRAGQLDNWKQIQKDGHDEQFPPKLESIAAKGQSCGDAAQGIHESCEKYNTWRTMHETVC